MHTFKVPSLSLLLTFVLRFSAVLADHHEVGLLHTAHKRHLSRTEPEKRDTFSNARFTEYEAGLGACGGYNTDGDFIVAINVPQYGSGELCGETVTLSYGGRTAQAQIVDECEICPYGGLDLTPSLFSYLSGDGVGPGVLYGSWSFGSGHTTSSTPPPAPPTTSHTSTTHKSTTTTSHTSTTFSTQSTTKKGSSTSLSSSTSAVATGTSSSSEATAAASSATSASPTITNSALADMNQAFLQIANYLVAAAAVDATNE